MRKNKLIVFAVAAAMAVSCIPPMSMASAADPAVKIYVSPFGNDTTGNGSYELPFKTIVKAQTLINSYKNDANTNEIKIILREGDYPPFSVNSENGGNENIKISYEAYQNEKATITDAAKLSPENFKTVGKNSELYLRIPYEARANVLEYDLTEDGISGVIPPTPLGEAQTDTACEPGLFIDDTAMQTARWPDNGYITLSEYATAKNPVLDPETNTYITEIENLATTDTTKWLDADNTYICGFLTNVYFYKRAKIRGLDEDGFKAESEVRPDAPVFFLNIPEELDSPGEWYYNQDENKIYVYPPDDIKDSDIRFVYKGGSLISGNADNITIDGLILNGSYGAAVDLTGKNIIVKNCIIKNGCTKALQISGESNRAEANHIYNMGMGGIFFYPDWAKQWEYMKTFTDDNNIITNNDIHDFNQVQRAYANGIYAYGVNSVISHNSLHSASGNAISFVGIGIICEYNEMYDVATEVGDAGAIYVGGAWLNRGHEIRYNKIYSTQLSDYVSGVFLDDCASANTISGNIIDGFASAVKIHGGMENVIENNVFSFAGDNTEVLDCGISVISKAGIEQMPDQTAPTHGTYKQELYYYAQNPAWQQRWPGLDSLFDREDYKYPSFNKFENNIFVGISADRMIDATSQSLASWNCSVDNNVIYENPEGFYKDYGQKDFRYEIPQGEEKEYVFGKNNDIYYRRYLRDEIGNNYNLETEIVIEDFSENTVGNMMQEYRGATVEVGNSGYRMQFSIEKDGIYVLNNERLRTRLKPITVTAGVSYKYGVKVRDANAQLYVNDEYAGSFELPEKNIDAGDMAADDIQISYRIPEGDNISFVMKSIKLDKVYPGGLVMADNFDKEYEGPGTKTASGIETVKLSDNESFISKDGAYSSDYIATSVHGYGDYLEYTVPEGCYITDISCVYTANPVKQNMNFWAMDGENGVPVYFGLGNKTLVRKDIYGWNMFRCSVTPTEGGKENLLKNRYTTLRCELSEYDDSSEYRVPGFLLVAIAYTGPGLENSEGIYNIYDLDFTDLTEDRFYMEFSSVDPGINREPYVTVQNGGVRFKTTSEMTQREILPVEKMGLYTTSETGLNNLTNYALINVDKASYKVYDEEDHLRIKFSYGGESSFDAIAAGYNDGKLVTVSKKTITGDDELTVSKDNITSLKLFIWDDISGGIPIEIAAAKNY